MIRQLTSFKPYWDFIKGFFDDPVFGEPMLQTYERQMPSALLAVLLIHRPL